jgi:hypothetical protein
MKNSSENIDIKFYLDYIDKEMSIMGILTTFCAIVSGIVLDRVLSAEANKGVFCELLTHALFYVIVGSILMLLAALSFYRQRSLLAWFYGQITLCLARTPEDVSDLLDDVDSWATWTWYQTAFGILIIAFIQYGLALLCLKIVWLRSYRMFYAAIPIVLGAAVLIFRRYVLQKYKYDDEPFKKFYSDFWSRNA